MSCNRSAAILGFYNDRGTAYLINRCAVNNVHRVIRKYCCFIRISNISDDIPHLNAASINITGKKIICKYLGITSAICCREITGGIIDPHLVCTVIRASIIKGKSMTVCVFVLFSSFPAQAQSLDCSLCESDPRSIQRIIPFENGDRLIESRPVIDSAHRGSTTGHKNYSYQNSDGAGGYHHGQKGAVHHSTDRNSPSDADLRRQRKSVIAPCEKARCEMLKVSILQRAFFIVSAISIPHSNKLPVPVISPTLRRWLRCRP